jgi:hypothetical protein
MLSDNAISYVLEHWVGLAAGDSMAVSGLASMFVTSVQRELRELEDLSPAFRQEMERAALSLPRIALKRHVNIWNMVCDELERRHDVFVLKRDWIKSVFAQVFQISMSDI